MDHSILLGPNTHPTPGKDKEEEVLLSKCGPEPSSDIDRDPIRSSKEWQSLLLSLLWLWMGVGGILLIVLSVQPASNGN